MYHIRRKEKEITDHQILRRILKETKYVTIAMVKDNDPYLVSMSHGYDEKNHCLYLHSANEGKKLDYLRSNMNIWGQATIDYGYHVNQCSHLYASVQFKGKVSFIEDLENKKHAFKTGGRSSHILGIMGVGTAKITASNICDAGLSPAV